ncbi:MAG: prolyl oligopeptidase family serine peptidase [Wenzhouxiangella sp.]|nr:prolyl oligopeptidase family serine peptidase [Wenzhouxiangella sp.]
MRLRALVFLVLCLLAPAGFAGSVDLRQIMADPAWMGPPVEAAWWQLDGSALVYRVRRDESELRDLYRIRLADGTTDRLDFADQAEIDGPNPVFHDASGRVAFLRDGNLFVRLPGEAQARQLSRSTEDDSQPMFSPSGERLVFRRGAQWWQVEIESGLAWPAANLRFEKDPATAPEDSLEQMQLRLFSSLRADVERERLGREAQRQAARDDASRAAAPWYLGDAMQPVNSSLSPDGRWLLLALRPASHNAGRRERMPHYVTLDGYVDIEEVRTQVGRNAPAPQTLWLLDLVEREKHELAFDDLPGVQDDPLAELKAAQELDPLPDGQNRALAVIGMQWHTGAEQAAVMLRAIDNKDRWIATVDTRSPGLEPRHRLTDEAWINWAFNDFGWLPGSDSIWFLSEESGYSHFYTVDTRRGRIRAHTSGEFEVMEPAVQADGRSVYLLSNRSHPTEYDLYRLDLRRDRLTRLTEHRGIESFTVLPGHEQILLRFSEPYLPAQVGLVSRDGGDILRLTDTRTESFRAMEWQAPEIVGIESSDGAGPIWSKFYPARTEAPEGGHPVVLFVHGAGYLQNTHLRYPQYFREQMFHNLLTERGYHVLDMDFRASRGYGRDWRTAIYRQMGTPELQDLIDGVEWLVSEYGANPQRVGVYGGSYGGFMAFMALLNAPAVFQAGAALRPVTDWAHYNHPYTSNILNTPDVDPEAYLRSSPLEFAEGLQGHLLITHGMLDANVFYQDVVRLAQRLIDLEKENWELASYPLERHGFTRASSWLDQYRRILNLFESTIGTTTGGK